MKNWLIKKLAGLAYDDVGNLRESVKRQLKYEAKLFKDEIQVRALDEIDRLKEINKKLNDELATKDENRIKEILQKIPVESIQEKALFLLIHEEIEKTLLAEVSDE